MNEHIEKRSLTDLRETFAPLRLANPKAQSAMNESLRNHGQVTPIACLPLASGLEVIDGFKRLFPDCPFQRSASGDFLDEEIF